MPKDRYPKQLVGNGKLSLIEVDRGKQGVEWLMHSVSLGLDKHEGY